MEATLREEEKRANKKGPITDNDHLGSSAQRHGGHHADRHARNIPTPMEVLLPSYFLSHSQSARKGRLQNGRCNAAKETEGRQQEHVGT